MLYFIQHGTDGPVKIGIVGGKTPAAVVTRLSSLQVGNPVRLRIIGFCEGGAKEEALLHKQFDKYRVSGEWFDFTPELINLIQTLSIAKEHDRALREETLAVGELVKKLKNEIVCDVAHIRLMSLISKDTNVPHYRIFGEKRYRYEDCKEYLISAYKMG
jgi:hypothetical protein